MSLRCKLFKKSPPYLASYALSEIMLRTFWVLDGTLTATGPVTQNYLGKCVVDVHVPRDLPFSLERTDDKNIS